MRPLPLAALFLLAQLLSATAEPFRFERREIPWGEPISMEEFGGPAVELSIRSRQISFVTVELADFTRMLPVLVNDATIYGPSRVVMQPARETRRVEKKNGTPVPGGRGDMYLLHIDSESGTHVYFADEAAGQNLDVIVIGVPQNAPASPRRNAATARRMEPGEDDLSLPADREPPAKTEKPRATKTQPSQPANDGYLSDHLLDWYLRLEKWRDVLNTNDPAAVARFNKEAAHYQSALKRARAAAAR